jgi:hypothetical protein
MGGQRQCTEHVIRTYVKIETAALLAQGVSVRCVCPNDAKPSSKSSTTAPESISNETVIGINTGTLHRRKRPCRYNEEVPQAIECRHNRPVPPKRDPKFRSSTHPKSLHFDVGHSERGRADVKHIGVRRDTRRAQHS